MSVTKQITEVQKKIIIQLAESEESIAKLYGIYSQKLPDPDTFWANISEEEKVHAELLRNLLELLDQGAVFRNIGRFNNEEIDSFSKKLREAINHAQSPDLTEEQAIRTALMIESSIIDAHFYDIVTSDFPGYQEVAKQLATDTKDHVKMVQQQMVKLLAQKRAAGKSVN